MASDDNIWFRIGNALERARQGAPSPRRVVPGLSEAEDDGEDESFLPDPSEIPSADELMTAGVTLLADRAFAGWGRSSSPGLSGLIRAGVSGVAAALLVELVRPLLRSDAALPRLDRDMVEHLLAGLGQGLVYGGAIEPRMPGPPLLKGAVYGSVEYAVVPFGGLSGVLGKHTPQSRIPVVGGLLDRLEDHDRAFLEHLVFGIALALIYESSDVSSGMDEDDG